MYARQRKAFDSHMYLASLGSNPNTSDVAVRSVACVFYLRGAAAPVSRLRLGEKVLGQEINEHPDLGRQIATRWPHRAKHSGVVDVLRQDDLKGSIEHLPPYGKIRYAHQPDSMLGQGNQGFYRACSSSHRQDHVVCRWWLAHEGPALSLAGRRILVMQTGVLCQFLGHRREAGTLEVRRRPDHFETIGAESPHHQPGIGRFPTAHDDVVSTVDDIDQMIGEIHVQLNARIGPHKLAYRRHHEHSDKRQAYLQLTPRRSTALRELIFDRVDLGEDAPAALQKQLSFLGQSDRACIAMEQANTEPLFEARDCLADGR